ncbi:hypothetical protein D3C73_1436080 [compost metagenome]
MEHQADKVLLQETALSDDFYNLRTGLAGTALQKFINYRIRTAAVIDNAQTGKGRFKELLSELNKGNDFRVFSQEEEALAWLLRE